MHVRSLRPPRPSGAVRDARRGLRHRSRIPCLTDCGLSISDRVGRRRGVGKRCSTWERTVAMADNTKIWSLIHTERRAVADTIEGLSTEQWTRPSLVEGWSIGQLASHMLRAAEQTPGRFLKQMAKSGFRFDKSMDDTARASELSKDEIVTRMRQRLAAKNPP